MKEAIQDIFIKGAIRPELVAKTIAGHESKTDLGAHDIFLGRVRSDEIDGKKVAAIEFTAQEEMANSMSQEIQSESFKRFDLESIQIYHSIGRVEAGGLCIFVMVSSGHRQQVFEALPHIVNELKARLPIFGKEIFEDKSHQWKVNK
ncbi:molybdenum cofactor biosynthesis protein MoaE [Algoriphagus sediminis]|uniref:Molybdopterin synthase catalytic subunit n=1 Tax=Algoriphagus sediminis TaxID=3057113 RepID=A0ABT7YFY2_9BACT|nr:molybdenum cofactor biosynthesis protein MoaE [Algoriphagus sediminis]MDN3205245.1 molybdenum cofactor biosynthesis protein MoaE [Algoriphagus sediminis]